ncbi:MAG: hypothetical protein GY851_32835 [bacterium]|nr:hypothetical protein [bacterium]
MTRFNRVALVLEKVLGLLFVAAAVPKALDLPSFVIQIAYYRVLPGPMWWSVAAAGSVMWETVLGGAMVAGVRMRGWTLLATLGTLLGFTGLIAYSWAYHDLADCGCFGKVLPMGPGASIAKNVVMMLMGAVAWAGMRHLGKGKSLSRVRLAVMVVCLAVVGAGVALGDNDAFFHPPEYDAAQPFAGFVTDYEGEHYDLAEGEYLAVVMSAGCDDCKASVEVLNEIALIPELMPVVGLLYGDEEAGELDDFRDETQPFFPTIPIDGTTFFRLIEEEPPRFYVVRDGVSLRDVETLEPDVDMLLELILFEDEAE